MVNGVPPQLLMSFVVLMLLESDVAPPPLGVDDEAAPPLGVVEPTEPSVFVVVATAAFVLDVGVTPPPLVVEVDVKDSIFVDVKFIDSVLAD